MRFVKTAETATHHGQPWPRVLGAVALAVLGVCGVIVLVIPSGLRSATSLESRSNWVLAGALPTSRDFPADWGYSLSGPLRRNPMPDTVVSNTPPPGMPRAVYTPAACTSIPKMLDHSGESIGPGVGVDRYTELQVNSAVYMDSEATGEPDEFGPYARLSIWVVADGPARIANYVDWLGRCGSYHVKNYDGDGRFKNERTVNTALESRTADGADAAVTLTRTFTTVGSREPTSTYHVIYYAVRGVILECSIHHMQATDRDLVVRRATETLQRLRAL